MSILTRFIATILLVIACFAIQVEPLTTAKRNTIKNGLKSGQALANPLKDGKFSESLKQLATKFEPYLKMLGPLADLALSLIPTGDSEEMKYMKEQFQQVNHKLDQFTAEFTAVKDTIEWSSVKVSYSSYEHKIIAAEENLRRIYRVEGKARGEKRKYFLAQYDSDFKNSVQKLYDGAYKHDRIFSKNILAAVVHQTKKHRRKFEQFSLGLLQLLIRGIQVKLSYFGMKKWSTAHLVKEWDQKIAQLRARMSRISNNIRRDYLTQMKIDIKDIIKKGGKRFSNKRLMHEIYDFVEDKYDWRYWFVAVYNDMKGFDKHAIASCGGHAFLHTYGKNIAVASQDKVYSSWFKKEKAAEILRSVESDVKKCVSGLHASRQRARALNGRAVQKSGNGCVPYALQMTVRSGNNLWAAGWGNHYSLRRIDLTANKYYPPSYCSLRKSWYYNMIIFG